MQTHHSSTKRKRKAKTKTDSDSKWRKIKSVTGLYQYLPSKTFFANVKSGGKLYRESLETTDLAFAKRKLHDKKQLWTRTDPKFGKITLAAWLKDVYFPSLRGSPSALADKKRIIDRVKDEWLQARTQPMRDLRESQVAIFLAQQYDKSSSYYNSALGLIRDALAMAVRDHVLMENPAANLKYRKRKPAIRLTPTYEEFQQIVADVRAQPFNRDADDSGDFLEAQGLLGLGQAELASMKREHVDLQSGRIAVFRHKTSTPFHIPIYPQARALIERLCEGKKSSDHLFAISQARKALTNACKRLELPHYTQRSLRRCFITRCLELGIDVKVIALWQGHADQGVLILQRYSHVRPEHSNRMAQLLSDAKPENVIPISQQTAS